MLVSWVCITVDVTIVQLKNTYIPLLPTYVAKHAKRKYNQNQLILCVEMPVSELDTDAREIPTKTFEETVT